MTRKHLLLKEILDLREDIFAAFLVTGYDLDGLKKATDELLMSATAIAERADEAAEAFRQTASGNVRTACQWCDADFYVHHTQRGPHTCRFCRHRDGY